MARVLALLMLGTFAVACASVTADDEGDGDPPALESDITGGKAVPATVAEDATFTTTSRLNLRSGPSTTDDVILTMPKGAQVTAVETATKNSFIHVKFNGKDGWAHGAYLKASSSGSEPLSEGSPSPKPPSPPVDGTFSGATHSNVTMLWQGNWDFLIKCDSFSKSAGRVVFFCDETPSRDFVDNGAWIAVPRNAFTSGLCGKSAKVCKGDRCVVAKVVEKSVTDRKWEGSTKVLETLGADVGFSSCTSSFGTATGVTVTMQ